jgi:eukaryotic-like serine/threonine-protein kinase
LRGTGSSSLEDPALRSERFDIVSKIGGGGMGIVYLARDRKRDVTVALKTLPELEPDALLRFKHEFRALQDVLHRNLVSLGELFEENGRWFFSMEYVDGVDLLTFIRGTSAADAPTEVNDASSSDPSPLFATTLPNVRRELEVVQGFDEARLRDAFAQLAEGLIALHATGKIHCDIKPSNILVARDGRVVLLDFGLVRDVIEERVRQDGVSGTFAYMSPEQALSKPLSPSADWYSVGVVLYEALTGTLPFVGTVAQIVGAKQSSLPPPPRERSAGVPHDLDQLAMKLLEPDPVARLDGQQVLSRFRGASSVRAFFSLAPSAPFVGRSAELAVLGAALEDARSNGAITVCVSGESGLGKSALVRHFTETVARERDGIVLSSRCHARESIRYNALDGIIDALTNYLRRLSDEEISLYLPQGSYLLSQVFPVLQCLNPIPKAPESDSLLDPVEIRSRVFNAFRELLSRLAADRTVVLAIDDLQWADADSLALLAEVLRPPSSPSVLLLLTVRSGFEAWAASHGAQMLPLLPLPPRDSVELATLLLFRAREGSQRHARALAEEASGHPLFLQELVRAAVDLGAGELRQLEEALERRMALLEPTTRSILEIVSIAAAPVSEDVLLRAAECDAVTLDRALATLRASNFTRSAVSNGERAVEPYHDRVREVLVASLEEAIERRHHERLARALESLARPELESLALHWRGAGEAGKAVSYAKEAAAKAMAVLAFHHAARLYRFCVELCPEGEPQKRALTIALADALAKAGRGAEAAASYLEAAASAPAAEALELKRHAGDQYLRMGQLERGQALLGEVLAEFGMKLPSATRALISLFFRRLQIKLSGLKFKERAASQISPAQLTKIDACWSMTIGMSMTDTLTTLYFQNRHLIFALESGEVQRIARALAMEIIQRAILGARQSRGTLSLAKTARALAERVGHAYMLGMAELAIGTAHTYWGFWREAREHLERARQIFHQRCAGVAWEIYSAEAYLLTSLLYLGDLEALRTRERNLIAAAEQNGDLHMLVLHRIAGGMMARLAEDQPDEGAKQVADAQGALPRGRFQAAHFLELWALTHADLYRGDPERALDRLRTSWPALKRSFLLLNEYVLVEMLNLRARAAAGAAARSKGARAERIRDLAYKDVRVLEGRGSPFASCCASVSRALLAAQKSDARPAIALFDRSIEELERAGMILYAQAARWRRAELTGGSEGANEKARAEEIAKQRGAVNPAAWLQMLAPR